MKNNSINKIESGLSNIIEQKKAIRVLTNAILNDKLAHGLLFVGPEGTGRTALAYELGRILNCTAKSLPETLKGCNCSDCNNSRLLQHQNLTLVIPLLSPKSGKDYSEKELQEVNRLYDEFRTIKSADHYAKANFFKKGLIHIREIRDLRKQLALSQVKSGSRVVIIQPADKMEKAPANALLKLLEEPPDNCIIILIAENLRTMLPTIVSRCQHISFLPLDPGRIATALQNRMNADETEAMNAAQFSKGSYSRARALLSENLEDKLASGLEFLRAGVTGNLEKATKIADQWSKTVSMQERNEKFDFLSFWISGALEQSAFQEESISQIVSLCSFEKITKKMASLYTNVQLSESLRVVEETRLSVYNNAIIPLAIFALVINLHRIFND